MLYSRLLLIIYFIYSSVYTGKGNGNPLQCSCLENPRDGGAWWAAVCGVAQSGHDWSDLAAAAAVLVCWREGKLENCTEVPQKTKIKITIWFTIPLLVDKTNIQKNTRTPMFTVAIAKTWKQPKCPLTDKWIKKMCYINTQKSLAFLYTNNEKSERGI